MPRQPTNWARVQILGLQEAQQMFADCKKAFTLPIIQDELLPAARIIRDDAKRRVNLGPGRNAEGRHLRNQIFATKGKPGLQDVIAGVDRKKAPHAHLVEFGTEPHMIRPRAPRKLLRIVFKDGSIRMLPFARHPGSEKRPFFRPAINSTRARVLESMTNGLKRLLGRAMRPTYGPVFTQGGSTIGGGAELP